MTMLVTLGVSLAIIGSEHADRQPATSRSHVVGLVPKSTPPLTFGQEMFSSIAAAPVADQPSSPPTGDGTRSAAASNTAPASRRTTRDGLPLVGPQVQRTSAAGSATAARPAPVKQITAAPVIQRATLQSPIPTATTVEVIQRAEGAVENAPTTSNRQALLNDLARQIYPLVKRMLAIERERRVFK